MSLPREHIMEQLHNAYVSAVVAEAGATYEQSRQDYGIDGCVSEVRKFPNGKYIATGLDFKCQLKATTNFVCRDDFVVYEMDVEAYNRLVLPEGPTLRLLVVLCLPKDWEDWLHISEDQLIMKHCCYWTHIVDSPSDNKRSKTVYIPRQNIFSPEAIRVILEQIKRGEEPNGLASK